MTTGLDGATLRTCVVLVPVVFVAALWLLNPDPRTRGAAFLAALWNAVFLVPVNMLAMQQNWWSFGVEGAVWNGVPVDLVLAWSVLWGATPILLGRWINPAVTAGLLLIWDMAAMGSLEPLVVLRPHWWLGEMLSVAACLVPGVLLGRLTAQQRQVRIRVGLQMLLFATILLVVLPALTLGVDRFARLPDSWSSVPVMALCQLIVVVGVVAVRAVAEFVRHGGTPYPWDPPARMVTTGPYAYVANPMQLSSVVMLLLIAAILRSPVMVLAALVAAAFSAGLAAWSEQEDLRARFGAGWGDYRAQVRDWLPRGHPTDLRQPAVLYVAQSCEACSDVRRWLEARRPVALECRPAEECHESLRRVRYEAADGLTLSGTRAIGAALEHVGLGWALAGWIMRVPVVASFVQLVADAAGAGPRALPPQRGRTQ
ncbi:hypothetical protein FZI91_13600 [Mycobacterium sp. CBMA271]|uniref:methyltransferase family protein n=1 Tax=unclassified Mycobacteroides TaxID=2618759 RepID=UPI0012DCF02A|nr:MULTISPECIES: methyltransferase [unclassified Mycobacteroides]MUM18768.1 hypothetical protein [Mycobacteroides sp. CBMA 326]MUM22731.1 hypothetical protein [Mycobacteroides sp. CBMA 271]